VLKVDDCTPGSADRAPNRNVAAAYPVRAYPVTLKIATRLSLHSRHRRVLLHTEASIIVFNRGFPRFGFTMAPSVARLQSRSSFAGSFLRAGKF